MPRCGRPVARSFSEEEVGRPDARDAEGDFARFSGVPRFSFVFWGSSACKLWQSVTFRSRPRQAVSEGPAFQLRRPPHYVASGGRTSLLHQASVSLGGASSHCVTLDWESEDLVSNPCSVTNKLCDLCLHLFKLDFISGSW